MRISDWSSDVCSSDLCAVLIGEGSDLSIIEYTAEILRPASHRRHFLRQDCSPEWRQGIAGAAHVPDQRKHEEKGSHERGNRIARQPQEQCLAVSPRPPGFPGPHRNPPEIDRPPIPFQRGTAPTLTPPPPPPPAHPT